jgi:hypothetical protein
VIVAHCRDHPQDAFPVRVAFVGSPPPPSAPRQVPLAHAASVVPSWLTAQRGAPPLWGSQQRPGRPLRFQGPPSPRRRAIFVAAPFGSEGGALS